MLITACCFLLLTSTVLKAQHKSVFRGILRMPRTEVLWWQPVLRLKKIFPPEPFQTTRDGFPSSLNRVPIPLSSLSWAWKLNYITLTLDAGESIEKDFQLLPLWQELEEVEIMVSKFEKPIEEITISMQVIKPTPGGE